MKVKNSFVLRKIAEEYMVIPISGTDNDLRGVFYLNESAAFLWEKLQKEQTIEEMTQELFDEYEIEKGRAKIEVENFISKLSEMNCLEE